MKIFKLLIVLILVFSIYTNVYAKNTDKIIDDKKLEIFLDDYFNNEISENKIAGVTISVVEGNEISLVKSYGTKNSRNNYVYTNNTMTRIGSITKVFVWQSILELYEENK